MPATRPGATGAVISGWGTALPEKVVTNHDLEKTLDTSDEWIVARTGISERRIGGSTASLSVESGRAAMEMAGLTPERIDALVVATATPDRQWGTAPIIQRDLGLSCGAFELNAACSGFVYGSVTAASMIAAGAKRTVLVVGVEKLHFLMDYRDRNTCVLFGDGAGAVVYEAIDDPADSSGPGVLGTDLGADGVSGSTMVVPTLGSRGELTSTRDPANSRLHFEGQAVFKIAVRGMIDSVCRALDRAGLTADDVDLVVPHQANERIIRAAASRLGLSDDQVMLNIATHGNTSAASIPMALNDALDTGRVRPGDIVVFTAFGGGVTWGSVVLRWGDRVERLGTSDAALDPVEVTVDELLAKNREFFAPLYD